MENDLISYPSGRCVSLINQILMNADDINSVSKTLTNVSHHINVTVTKGRYKEYFVNYRSDVRNNLTDITVKIEDVTLISKLSRKFFNIILMRMANDCLSNGQIVKDYVTIPLETLVEGGVYKSIESARNGFKRCAKSIVNNIYCRGNIFNNENVISQDCTESIFLNYKIKMNVGYIFLNSEFNYNLMFLTYTKIPYKSYLKLNLMSGDFLIYIMVNARMKRKNIKNNQSLNMNLENISKKLGLCNIEDTKNPKRDIIDKLNNCMNDICNPIYQIGIKIVSKKINFETSTAREILEGYLEIKLDEKYIDYFSNIQTKKDKRGRK